MQNEIKNADMPAFPLVIEEEEFNSERRKLVKTQIPFLGLTKREEIASRIAEGLAGNTLFTGQHDTLESFKERVAIVALEVADSLLQKLEQQ